MQNIMVICTTIMHMHIDIHSSHLHVEVVLLLCVLCRYDYITYTSDMSSQFCCMLVKYIRMLTKNYASGISKVYTRQISALVNKIPIPEQIIISETIRSFHVKSYFEAVCFNIWFVTGTGMRYVIFLVCQHAQK